MIKNFALYILRLLAGKLEKICTAFPMTTFLTNILIEYPVQLSRQTKFNIPSCTQTNDSKHEFLSKKTKILNPVNICLCPRWYVSYWDLVNWSDNRLDRHLQKKSMLKVLQRQHDFTSIEWQRFHNVSTFSVLSRNIAVCRYFNLLVLFPKIDF